MSALRLEAIRKTFGPVEVIKGVDLEVEAGEFLVFVGPSGCGKSTLLRIIAGLEEQTFGHVFIHDRNVDVTPPARREIAMVFQTYALYPHLTVRGNMELGLKQAKVPPAEIERRVTDAARMLHLGDYESRKPQALSGGQRQRVAIGRAIVREPKLFLFDEPLSNLDAALRVNTRVEIAKLRRMLQTTIIYVTHDQVEAMTLADRIVVLNEGRIEQIGTPMELYHRPANLFVAGFIGSPRMNFQCGEKADSFGAKTIGVRPEHLALVEPEAGLWTGTVAHSERLGADTFLYVEAGQNDLMTVRKVGDIDIPPGATLHLAAAGPVHRFDAKGTAMDTA